MAHCGNQRAANNELRNAKSEGTSSCATSSSATISKTSVAKQERREQGIKDGTKGGAVSRVLSPFEQARALSFRAQQLSYGAKPHVDVPDGVYDSFQIATLELQQNQLRISLRRFDPSGAHKDVDVDTLIKPQTMYPDPTKPVLFNNETVNVLDLLCA